MSLYANTDPECLEHRKLALKKMLDEGTSEQELQGFLERNTEFIPRQFVQHHGIASDLVLTKLSFGRDLVSDLAFVSASSKDFWIVLIELEKPTSKFFKQVKGVGQISLHSDFRRGLEQVSKWRSWLSEPSNLDHLYRHELGPIVQSHIWRKVVVKYVLVTGRREMYKDTTQLRSLVKAEERDDFAIMTWDSILEHPKEGDPLYVGKRRSGFIDILTEDLISDRLFNGIEPGAVRLNRALRANAEGRALDGRIMPRRLNSISVPREVLNKMGDWS